MRTFVQLRRLMDSNADLARKIENLEKKYDEKFATVFAAIKQLIAPSAPAKKRIGFHPGRSDLFANGRSRRGNPSAVFQRPPPRSSLLAPRSFPLNLSTPQSCRPTAIYKRAHN